MATRQGYSAYIRPISYVVDLLILNGLAVFYIFKSYNIPNEYVVSAITLSWIVLSAFSSFYEVYRYTKEVKIAALILKQFALFLLLSFALSGIFYKRSIHPNTILKFIGIAFVFISIAKFLMYYLLQKYRSVYGGNHRKTILLGRNKQTMDLANFFTNNPEYGYELKKIFYFKDNRDEELLQAFKFIANEDIDEIYCSISEFSNKQLLQIIDFADNNLKILKFLPDNKNIYSKKLRYEYYNYIPILSLRNIPLQEPISKIVKRAFDILFASFVIVFILSWLTPLLAILIRLESKGPIFFKQSRNGFNYKEFDCYKFRSMTPNKEAHLHQATKNDNRITKVGKFIRKTSIDELPQFYNVLFGDMSVVGPRPHMVSHTDMYAKRIDKFMVRHFVKPGITGLAQISGFRGEIETDKDIINRVKYDIFYVENWSLLLDIKIILQTVFNAVKGEEKAY